MTEVHRIRVFDYTPSPIVSVSLNDVHLLVGRSNGYVEIWNVRENVFLEASFYAAMKDDLTSAAWCKYHDQTFIVVARLSGELILVEYPSLTFTPPISSGRDDNIFALAVNREQDKIAIACQDSELKTGFVSIFALNDTVESSKSDNFESLVLSVCFGHNGMIYAGTKLGKIGCIDPESGRIVTTYDANYSSESAQRHIFALTAVPGGCFASGDSEGEVMIWDPNTATVVNKFSTHQYDIKALASNDRFLWASGVDPRITTFSYTKSSNSWSPGSSKTRVHDHEVTCLASAGDNSQYCISGSKDATFFFKKTIYPFQAPHPISSATRLENNSSSNEDQQLSEKEDNPSEKKDENESNPPINHPLVVVGSSSDHQLAVWKLNGKVAKLELKLNVDSDENQIECVAMCPGGNEFAYSASSVRVLKYIDNNRWTFDNKIKKYQSASALTYSNGGILYIGFKDGRIISIQRIDSRDHENSNDKDNDAMNSSDGGSIIVEKSFKLQFPVFKIAVSSNGNFVAAGGFDKISVLDGNLTNNVCDVPSFGSFSTFAFQPFKNRLFIANGGSIIFCFNVLKNKMLSKLKLKFEKSDEEAAVNSISFSDNNNHQMLISSSQRAIVRNIKDPKIKPYRLPYKNILFVTFSGYKRILIFEKPWVLIASSIPDVLSVKRFLTRREEDKPRYS